LQGLLTQLVETLLAHTQVLAGVLQTQLAGHRFQDGPGTFLGQVGTLQLVHILRAHGPSSAHADAPCWWNFRVRNLRKIGVIFRRVALVQAGRLHHDDAACS
jgi:hypothetical protein